MHSLGLVDHGCTRSTCAATSLEQTATNITEVSLQLLKLY